MKHLILAAGMTLAAASAQAQSGVCEKLCDPDFWPQATFEQIKAEMVSEGVNARSEDGLTPLHYAAIFGSPEAIVALLEAGADGSIRDDESKTPFDLARDRSSIKGTDVYWKLNDARFK